MEFLRAHLLTWKELPTHPDGTKAAAGFMITAPEVCVNNRWPGPASGAIKLTRPKLVHRITIGLTRLRVVPGLLISQHLNHFYPSCFLALIVTRGNRTSRMKLKLKRRNAEPG